MEGGSAILRSSSSVDHQSVPNPKYHQQQQQKMRSESSRNGSKNHHQIRRYNSMLLDQKTMMMMMRMEHQYQYPPHPQYQYHGGRGGGIFLNPPISLATSPSLPPIRQGSHLHNNNQQPPLLPLPVQYFQSPIPPPKRTQSLSPTKSNKIAAKVDENGTTASPKKPSSTKPQPKNNSNYKSMMDSSPSKTTRLAKTRTDDSLIDLNPSGPEPESLPKDVSKVLLPAVGDGGGGRRGGVGTKMVSFSSGGGGSSIFSLAPPPSSLPLPKFSILRPKVMSCNAQAGSVTAGGGGLNVVDTTGATDNLCRLLNLR